MKTIKTTENEFSVVCQFVQDNTIGSIGGTNLDNDATMIEDFLNKIRKFPEPGDLIISGNLTMNGGNIEFDQMTKLESQSRINERRNHFSSRSSNNILIEPIGYPHIEPYDRQQPYYIGYSYANLLKVDTEKFGVYTTKIFKEENPSKIGNKFTCFDEFWYNDFWKSFRFGLAIEHDKVDDFIKTLLFILGYDDDVTNIVLEYAKNVVDNYIDKSEFV